MNTQTDYPHEKIQSTILEHLLSALELSELHEEIAGKNQRQEALRGLISDYLDTLEAIQSGRPLPVVPARDEISW